MVVNTGIGDEEDLIGDDGTELLKWKLDGNQADNSLEKAYFSKRVQLNNLIELSIRRKRQK